jgi:hypothetical protein
MNETLQRLELPEPILFVNNKCPEKSFILQEVGPILR